MSGLHFNQYAKTIVNGKLAVIVNIENRQWIRLQASTLNLIRSQINEGKNENSVFKFFETSKNPILFKTFKNLLLTKIIISKKEEIKTTHQLSDVALLVTGRCNLRCKHCCFVPNPLKNAELDLPTSKVIHAIKKIAKALPKEGITITGGEPLVREDFPLLIKKAGEIFNKKVTLQTNAVLINKKNANLIAQNVSGVDVSLDGYDESSVKVVRGKNIFHKVIKNIKYLQAAGLKDITLSFVVTRDNMKGENQFLKLADKLAVKPVLRTFIPLGLGEKNKVALEPIKKNNHKNEKNLDSFSAEIADTRRSLTAKEGCGAGKRALAIYPNGDIFPCPSISVKQVRMGNIFYKESLLQQISQSEKEGKLSCFNVDSKPYCCDCSVRYFCGYCPAEGLGRTGSLEIKPELCKEKKFFLDRVVWGQ